MTQSPVLFSVVIPAFNEAESIKDTISEVVALLSPNFKYEILLIDDGSTDNTSLVAHQLTHQFKYLTYIRLSRNFGKEAALTAGLHRAKGDAVIMLDADGQHPAELILTFIKLWQEGYETIYGVQEKRQENSLTKWAKQTYYGLMFKFASIDIPANAGDFRLLDRKAVTSINLITEGNRYMKGLYAWVGYKSIGVPYTARKRNVGNSKFGFFKLFKLGISGLTGFSVIPLKLVSITGLFVSIAAFGLGIEILIEHLVVHKPLPGWPTLAVGMMFFAGIELLALGIIGEYVGNIFEEVKKRPLYLIAEESSQHMNKSD